MGTETFIIAATAFITFLSTVLGTLWHLRRGNSDDMTKFRADLFLMIESLRDETEALRARVSGLEKQVDDKTKEIDRLELTIARINLYLLKEHGIDLVKIFGDILDASN
jgi:uncharacterized protein YoxC